MRIHLLTPNAPAADELIEVTPKSIRLRKKELDEGKRRRNSKASMQAKKN